MAAAGIMKEVARAPSAGQTGFLAWCYDFKLSVSTLPGYVSSHIRPAHQSTAETLTKG